MVVMVVVMMGVMVVTMLRGSSAAATAVAVAGTGYDGTCGGALDGRRKGTVLRIASRHVVRGGLVAVDLGTVILAELADDHAEPDRESAQHQPN